MSLGLIFPLAFCLLLQNLVSSALSCLRVFLNSISALAGVLLSLCYLCAISCYLCAISVLSMLSQVGDSALICAISVLSLCYLCAIYAISCSGELFALCYLCAIYAISCYLCAISLISLEYFSQICGLYTDWCRRCCPPWRTCTPVSFGRCPWWLRIFSRSCPSRTHAVGLCKRNHAREWFCYLMYLRFNI